VLNELRVTAMVGLSADAQKASSFVANCLLGAGRAEVSINPKASARRQNAPRWWERPSRQLNREGRGWRLTALTSRRTREHTLHMKRTNLVLDEELLKEATRLSGGKTYSGTVNIALRDFVRRAKARRILDLAGSGDWEGELAAMRDDAPRARKR